MITLQSSPVPPPLTRRSIALPQLLLVFVAIATLLLCGCASRAHWKMEAFALTAPSGGVGSGAHTNILSLHRVTVSPLFEGQPFVYRTGENGYERDPYAGFLIPLNRMLEQCLRICLRDGHAFADVIEPGSSLKSSCSMEVSVSRLYGDFRQPGQPFAVLQVRFLLYSSEPANRGTRALGGRVHQRTPPRAPHPCRPGRRLERRPATDHGRGKQRFEPPDSYRSPATKNGDQERLTSFVSLSSSSIVGIRIPRRWGGCGSPVAVMRCKAPLAYCVQNAVNCLCHLRFQGLRHPESGRCRDQLIPS